MARPELVCAFVLERLSDRFLTSPRFLAEEIVLLHVMLQVLVYLVAYQSQALRPSQFPGS